MMHHTVFNASLISVVNKTLVLR